MSVGNQTLVQFPAIGTFVFARTCGDDSMVVVVRFSAVGVTVGVSLAGQPRIVMDTSGTVTVGGVAVLSFPMALYDGTVLWQDAQGMTTVYIAWTDVYVSLSAAGVVTLDVPATFVSWICGLVGPKPWRNMSDFGFGQWWMVNNGTLVLPPPPVIRAVDPFPPVSPPCSLYPAFAPFAGSVCSVLVDPMGPYGPCLSALGNGTAQAVMGGCSVDACAFSQMSRLCESFGLLDQACRSLGLAATPSVIDDCGVCFGDGSSCTVPSRGAAYVFGYGAFYTFDGRLITFPGSFEYRLVRSVTPGSEFDV